MTDKAEKRALLSRIGKFVTRCEFIAEQMKAERPGSASAALANDMLVASHLVRQFVAHVPDAALLELCFAAGYGQVKAEWENASREGKACAGQLFAQMEQLEIAVSALPSIVAQLAAPPTSTDMVQLNPGMAPRPSRSLH
ncbi:hypothetical protein [Rhodanobacter aciditrophus]|uniref:hypothetical protein n=1 Tax=Rhodanobacter aciditrophus TaxID=1623218 RepID=UPI003CF673C1